MRSRRLGATARTLAALSGARRSVSAALLVGRRPRTVSAARCRQRHRADRVGEAARVRLGGDAAGPHCALQEAPGRSHAAERRGAAIIRRLA